MSISSNIIPLSHNKGNKINIQETLKHYGITSVWHFTDISNLESIQKHGLLSLSLLKEQGIYVPCYGADRYSHKRDKERGLDNFVHLSLIPDYPMQYVKKMSGEIPNPVWIEIDISVLHENISGRCNQVANANSAEIYEIKDIANVINLKRLLNNPRPRDPIKKAQLIVANRIDYSKIKGVYHG